jgi:hypothetical protein
MIIKQPPPFLTGRGSFRAQSDYFFLPPEITLLSLLPSVSQAPIVKKDF